MTTTVGCNPVSGRRCWNQQLVLLQPAKQELEPASRFAATESGAANQQLVLLQPSAYGVATGYGEAGTSCERVCSWSLAAVEEASPLFFLSPGAGHLLEPVSAYDNLWGQRQARSQAPWRATQHTQSSTQPTISTQRFTQVRAARMRKTLHLLWWIKFVKGPVYRERSPCWQGASRAQLANKGRIPPNVAMALLL